MYRNGLYSHQIQVCSLESTMAKQTNFQGARRYIWHCAKTTLWTHPHFLPIFVPITVQKLVSALTRRINKVHCVGTRAIVNAQGVQSTGKMMSLLVKPRIMCAERRLREIVFKTLCCSKEIEQNIRGRWLCRRDVTKCFQEFDPQCFAAKNEGDEILCSWKWLVSSVWVTECSCRVAILNDSILWQQNAAYIALKNPGQTDMDDNKRLFVGELNWCKKLSVCHRNCKLLKFN